MKAVRVIVYNADESFGPSLRGTLNGFEAVRIVAEVDEPAMLPQVVKQFRAEVLFIHLDPAPELLIQIAGELTSAFPNLALFALSESTDGQLILSVMRHGFREFITKPIDQGILGDALEKVAAQKGSEDEPGQLISFVGTIGGAGSTSLATNLAVELASVSGERVALVDLDYRFGQVATFLDVTPTYTIADLAQSHEQLDREMVEKALVQHSSGVYVLSRPAHFVQSDNITAAHCVGVLSVLMAMNKYVIVDGPNRYDTGASAILDLADIMFLVVQLLVPSVRNAQRIIQGMQEAGFNMERTKLLCNRAGKDDGSLMLTDIETTLGRDIFATIPDDWTLMRSAVNVGEPLITRGPKSKLRAAIRELAERIHAPDGPTDDKSAAKKEGAGLLSKIFSDA